MKRKREEQETASPSAVMSTCPSEEQPCVSMVIRVEHKEGVSWRNAGVALTEEQVGLVLCFNVRVAVMGPVVTWGRDPKNRQMLEKEADKGKRVRPQEGPGPTSAIGRPAHPSCLQVLLAFSGASAAWFPVIQPGSTYRLVATDSQVSTSWFLSHLVSRASPDC